MKISEIQANLEALKEIHGDAECLVSFKNQKGDWICDKKIQRIYYDEYAISPDCISVNSPSIVFKINGMW